MAKTRAQKELTLGSLTDLLKESKSAVFADFRGLPVKDATAFRNKARKENVEVVVAKKTLMRLAFDKAGYEGIDPVALDGSLVLVLGMEDEIAPARLVAEFGKDRENFKIAGGVLERKMVDASAIKALAKLPTKTQLIGQLVSVINGPLSGLVNVLSGNLRGLVNVLNAVKDAKPAA